MTLDDIFVMFEKDSKFDRTELGDESLKIASLHGKYFKLYSEQRLKWKKMESEYKKLYKLKHEYYMGVLPPETLDQYGWEPNALRILKQDLPLYLDSDEDLNSMSLKIEYQKEKINALEGIIKHINNRGFQIKAAIDWAKFTAGI